MKKSSWINTVLFVSVFLLTILFVFWFLKSAYFPILNLWIQSNIILYVVSLFFVKILGIVWPPISGGVFTLASIPFLGWKLAFITDFCGSTVGGLIAYYLGSKYGFPFLNKLLGDDIVNKIKKVKIKKGREIEAVFVYRFLFGSVILEAIYYGAGVLNINFGRFVIGAVLSHIVIGVPIFFLASSIFSGANMVLTISLSIIALVIILKTKGRYFE